MAFSENKLAYSILNCRCIESENRKKNCFKYLCLIKILNGNAIYCFLLQNHLDINNTLSFS